MIRIEVANRSGVPQDEAAVLEPDELRLATELEPPLDGVEHVKKRDVEPRTREP